MRPEPTIVQRAAEIHGTRRRLVFGFAAADPRQSRAGWRLHPPHVIPGADEPRGHVV